VLRTTRADFADNAARMDDPRCVAQQLPIGSGAVAQQLPIGSGAVASLCTSLIAARAKQAGLRWTRTGAQAVATLRARRASGDGAPFWASHPLQERLRLGPPARPRRRAPAGAATPAAEAPPLVLPAPAEPSPPPPPSGAAAPASPARRPAATHPWRRAPIGRARCA
jgi:hypothetical protein